jgi:hypothetical protein
MTASGGCLCGAVRYEVRGPLRGILVCHCSECRRWSGQSWAATAARRKDFFLVGGDTLRWVVSPASDSGARRGFCSRCGSCLFWDAAGPTFAIAAGSLDDPTGLAVIGHTYVGQAAGYERLPACVPRHTGLPA